ncbi:alcohol dehydrogenase catalytic domain-containing protein [Nonomuraea ferruginea]
MRALITDPAAPGGLRLGETPDPVPAPDEALVRVTATSLNHGEASLARQGAPAGAVLGWDAAGVVVRPAGDGSSPPAGTPVITLGMAERLGRTARRAHRHDGHRARGRRPRRDQHDPRRGTLGPARPAPPRPGPRQAGADHRRDRRRRPVRRPARPAG